MHLSKPSPAMIVALVALVFAMTGTGFAAKSALIDGAKIKNSSVSAKKLAATAVVPKGYAVVAVKTSASSSARAAESRDSYTYTTNGNTPVAVPTTTTTTPTPTTATDCPAGQTRSGSVCVSLSGVIQALIPAPVPGAAGTDAALPAGVRVTIPGGSLASIKFAPAIGTSSALGTYQEVQMVTPNQPIKISKLTAEIMTHGASQPAVVAASLLVDGVGVAASCSIVTAQSPKCTYDSPVSVPAGSKIAWVIQTTGVGLTAWDSYDLSLGYQSQSG